MKGFAEVIISGECGHWCQGLGASLGFRALAPRGETFMAEKWLVQAQQWHGLPLGASEALRKEPMSHKCLEDHAEARVCFHLPAGEFGFFFSSHKQGELLETSEHMI